MGDSTVWWLLVGAAVAVELLTGTFYLMMIAVGFTAGAIASHLGFGAITQIVVAAVVGAGAVVGWRWARRKNPPALPAQSNADVNIDIGEIVQVTHWNADGTSPVRFRGAQWTAVAAIPAEAALLGSFRISAMVGNRLVITKFD